MGADPQPPNRANWVDLCKGICIVLVVFGHIVGGLGAGGTIQPDSIWLEIRSWIYLFHMPAFFALSGIFAGKSVSLSPGDFFIGKSKTILYPYVIWTVIIFASQFVMSRFVNNPPDPHRALLFFVEPYGYGLWFLYALFIISTCYYLLAAFRIPAAGIALIALALSLTANFNWFSFWPIFNIAMSYFAYYACAAFLSTRILPSASGNQMWILPLFGISFLAAITILFLAGQADGQITRLLCGFLGTAAVICVAKGFDRFPIRYLWSLLGLFSLEIYLGHPLWGTVARVALLKAGGHAAALFVLGGVLIGVGGSLVVGFLCRKWNFPYLFRWPAKPRLAQ